MIISKDFREEKRKGMRNQGASGPIPHLSARGLNSEIGCSKCAELSRFYQDHHFSLSLGDRHFLCDSVGHLSDAVALEELHLQN